MSHKSKLNQMLGEPCLKLTPLAACIHALVAGGLLTAPSQPAQAALPVPYTLPIPVPGQFVSSGNVANPVITGKNMRINQRSDKAILNWQKFDVGKGYSVRFAQPRSSSIALNRIHEETDPSHILGTITANGQIYLVNKNGFVFEHGSVTNTAALVASALNITDDTFNKGIVRVFDEAKGNADVAAAFDGKVDAPSSYKGVNPKAEIKVDAGAKINAGKSGNVILAAPNVSNAGSIAAEENGQIMLVASKDKVYLQPSPNDANNPFSGLLVEVETGGKVTNAGSGEISARQGNITLAGFAVKQDGKLKATTSVNNNGSVRLLAREKISLLSQPDGSFKLNPRETTRPIDLNDDLKQESKVTFGAGSSVKILADTKGGTAIDEQEQKKSFVEASANKIQMESGSTIVAPSGKVNLTATNNLGDLLNPTVDPLQGKGGRIQLESGSSIDVSGLKNVKAPISRNVAPISVQTFNLRNAPYQKGGILQGKTVNVDIRKDTKILDASGGKAGIKRGIEERLGEGGEINLTSTGDVVVNSGAVANISGGSVKYKGGFIKTTKLLSNTGQLVDIDDADPDEQYVKIFGTVTRKHDKWGPDTTEKWNVLGDMGLEHFEPGYIDGKAAGKLNIQSPLTSWNGQVIAGSVNSTYQRENPVSGGEFSLNNVDNTGIRAGIFLSSQNVLFQTQQQPTAIDFETSKFPTKPDGKAVDLVLPTSLANQTGLSSISIKTGGHVTVADDAAISMPVLSSIKAEAGNNIDIKGSIYSAGGNLEFNSVFLGENTGKINIAGNSVMDVSGSWINDFQKGPNAILTEPVIIDGGKVSLKADTDLKFNSGALIKADGGAQLGSDGFEFTPGKAGEIELSAGASTIKGSLELNGVLSAYGLSDGESVGEGGHLSLSANKINIGDNPSDPNALNLGVSNGNFDFAALFGFSSLSLESNQTDITVESDTDLNLVTQHKVVNEGQPNPNSAPNFSISGEPRFNNTIQNVASSTSIDGLTQLAVLPEHLRRPIKLTMGGLTGVTMETGSAVRIDKQSVVNVLSTNLGNGIFIDGLISAPAGKINIGLDVAEKDLAYNPKQSIWLGSNANLLATGTSLFNPVDELGNVTGEALKGGEVTITAERGYVVLEEGSNIDVSGSDAKLDLPVARAADGSVRFTKRTVGSDAGLIKLTSADGIVLDGSLNAKAGSPTNRTGGLVYALNRNNRQDENGGFPTNTLHIDVTQLDQKALPSGLKFGDALPESFIGQAGISSEEIASAGVDDLFLSLPAYENGRPIGNPPGEVRFLGDVNLNTKSSINVDAQTIKWAGLNGSTAGNVNLKSSFLQLGSSSISEIRGQSSLGGGKLTTNADWTQLIGATLLTGFNQVNLNSTHDMRAVGVRNLKAEPAVREFVGNLSTEADLNLTASQIYPSTLSNYTFSVTNSNGKLSISGNNTDTTPLSAAGKLVFNAPVIEQNGVIKGPLGTIELNAAKSLSFGRDSLTSVSADGKTIPLGEIFNNIWRYPLLGSTNSNLVFNEKPDNVSLGEKHLVFKSPDIDVKAGSIIDVSGGGDLLAYEFQPGLGGEFDYLASGSKTYRGGFAILPSLGSSLAPYDHFLSNNFNVDPRAQVFISGIKKVPTGNYTVLPARYALLPGAYLVTPRKNSQDQFVPSVTKSGLPVISGYQSLAGTNIRDPRLTGYQIENRSQVRKNSEYNLQSANKFFKDRAEVKETGTPLLPQDSGQISIQANTRLNLDGILKVAAPNGRGAKMDIAAGTEAAPGNIEVVKTLGTQSPGSLGLLDQQLSKLSIDSLLLGGKRKFDSLSGTTNLSIVANDVIIGQGTQVQSRDLIAAAKNNVIVESGASINSSGTVNTGESIYNLTGDGALLRVSADKQVEVNRSYPVGKTPGLTGNLLVENGAVLAASKSMLLDSSKATVVDGNIVMKGGSLSITANDVNIGEFAGLAAGSLNLTNQKLASFTVDDFLLKSRGAINFYGNVGRTTANGSLEPLEFNRLVLDAKAFSGYENADKATRLQADSILVQNSTGVASPIAGTGLGTLDITANNYSQGSGPFNIDGFNTVNISAAKQFAGTGNSKIKLASDLNLNAGVITTTDGKRLEIDAAVGTGHNVIINGNGSQNQTLASDFGGNITVKANNIALNTANVFLPSGILELTAQTGDIQFNGKTDIDLAGRSVNFADTFDFTPGGTLSADAKSGKITLAANSNVNVNSGGGSASGGNLIFKAPQQTLDLLGDIKASKGSALIDVANYSATASFDSLMNKLMAAGVSDSLYFRTHNADIIQAVGNQIKADAITLVADKGAIGISGVLNADGTKEGGDIGLYAGGKISLESGAVLTAKGATKGGKVFLSSDDSLEADLSGIEVKAGSAIDVRGASTGGEVTLSALRTADNANVNIKPIAGAVIGAKDFFAQGVKKYATVDTALIDSETSTYMTAAAQNVATSLGSGTRLRPGVEIDYTGDLNLATVWDFASQRFGQNNDTPGALVIRASDSLTVTSDIKDGFDASGILQNGDSWSFQLTSGADLSSADKSATLAAKNLTIGPNASVHTGSGDIKLASGGDFVLTDQASTVFSAGRADVNNPYGTDGIIDLPSGQQVVGEYPIDGGDLSIRADGKIKGAISNQFFNDNQFINQWLVRQGGDNGLDAFPTAWAVSINAGQFEQNIGSFGGGKVDIAAGDNIDDLSVMMPTTGKQLGNFTNSVLEIIGGGKLSVKAGKDITGGAYYLGKGEGIITAGGEIKGSTQTGNINAFTNGPQLLMSGDPTSPDGSSSLFLNASQGIKISAVSDAMILSPFESVLFFSYTDKDQLNLKSLSGDVHLNTDTSIAFQTMGLPTNPVPRLQSAVEKLSKVFPASLDATAFNGSVILDNDIVLFPSTFSSLNVFAKQAIDSNLTDSNGRIVSASIAMSDADPALLPRASTPFLNSDGFEGLASLPEKFNVANIFASPLPQTISQSIHAVTPLHGNDNAPARLVTQAGDITNLNINLPKPAIIQAGRDLSGTTLQIQHNNPSDDSVISAGRDIIYELRRDQNGLADSSQNSRRIEIAGPGDVLVKTGRNFDFGSSSGLTTVGNLFNTQLPSGGASLDILVGMNGNIPSYAEFISKYQDKPIYAEKFNDAKSVIAEFMRQRSGNPALSVADAFTAFKSLKGDQTLPVQAKLNALLTQVFFNELKIAGSASAADKKLGNEGGFAAIDTLFPGQQWKGDLRLFFSRLHTISGGDINLFVPGGKVDAGLAVAPSGSGSKTSEQLGIVAQTQGQINAFVKDDFNVNTSRVFTLSGGDVLIWSSEGDIDAGKGAKTALSVTPIQPFFDKDGVLQTPPPKITNGSGIRTATVGESSGEVNSPRRRRVVADNSQLEAGDVFLFAPKGVVNAGEAGIAGNNVTISATAVLGANNIQVGGISTGVPTAPQSAAAGLTGTSNLSAGVTQMAETSVAANDRNSQLRDSVLGLVSVDILGFGE